MRFRIKWYDPNDFERIDAAGEVDHHPPLEVVAAEEYDRLKAERDELRAACEAVQRCLDYRKTPEANPLAIATDRNIAERMVRAALAKYPKGSE